MAQYESILFVSQGLGEETEGLAMAVDLALRHEARLEILQVSPGFPPSLREHGQKYTQLVTAELKRNLAEIARRPGLEAAQPDKYSITVEAGTTPGVRIIRHALRREHDLIIKLAERGNSPRGFRAIDMDLLRQSPVPVMLLKGEAGPISTQAVGVAIDPMAENDSARYLSLRLLTRARRLADMASGELHVISCWSYEFEDYLRDNPLVSIDDSEVQAVVNEERIDHRKALDALIAKSGIEGKVKVHHLKGRPDKTIADATNDLGIDLLVMGTVARTGLSGFLIGNTAENILRELSCSLLAMKPADFKSPVKAWDE